MGMSVTPENISDEKSIIQIKCQPTCKAVTPAKAGVYVLAKMDSRLRGNDEKDRQQKTAAHRSDRSSLKPAN